MKARVIISPSHINSSCLLFCQINGKHFVTFIVILIKMFIFVTNPPKWTVKTK